MAEVYLEMAKVAQSKEDQQFTLIKAISACSSYSHAKTREFDKFDHLEPAIMTELKKIGFDRQMARTIAAKDRNGDGFAFLAEELVKNNRLKDALELVNEGITYQPGSTWLNLLKVDYHKKLWPADSERIEQILGTCRRNAEDPESIPLLSELGKHKYMSFLEHEATLLFGRLGERTYGVPKRLLIEQFKDT